MCDFSLKKGFPVLHIIFAAALLLSLTGCFQNKRNISQTWFFSYTTQTGKGFKITSELTPENFIDLRSDGSFTSYLDTVEYGRWKEEKGSINFKLQNGNSKKIQVKNLAIDEIVLDLTPDETNRYYHVFSPIPNETLSELDNPFATESQIWRIKPHHSENEKELKDRLRNHFSFWEKYFNWALINNMETLDIHSEQSPLKLYSNGFELIPFEKLSEKWKNCFANDEECLQAWNILKDLISSRNISWPKTDNRFKAFLSVFQQMQSHLH
ncbi:MAG: hypothetical protein H6549_06630 [Chitinophagales bacterium]|nr:hypothetical protein [Chitinophagales bacterium]